MESESKPVANINAEKSVLGGILLDNNAYIEAAECLTPEDFSTDANRKIFNRMVGLMESGRPIDQVTLPDELERNKEYAKIGGTAYIASLVDGLPDRPSIAEYVAIVKDKSLLRRIIRVCELGIARAQAQDKPLSGRSCSVGGCSSAARHHGIRRTGIFPKNDTGYFVVTCTDCLRSFSVPDDQLGDSSEVRSTTCTLCGTTVRYIADLRSLKKKDC